MCEPLRGKKHAISSDYYGIEEAETVEIFSKEDVKSAVEGFLKEMKKHKKMYAWSDGDKAIDDCVEFAEKWFGDVI